MDRFRTLLVPLALCLAWSAQAAEIEGVHFPQRRSIGATPLALHGVALLRYRVFFKGYVAALYLGEGVPASAVLEDVPRHLEIEYFWPIAAPHFAEATVAGIARNVEPAALEALRPSIEAFNRLYVDVEPGDRYAISYVPGSGTQLSLNGVPRGHVPGAAFSQALFSIWLGERPFDDDLKAQLLTSAHAR